MKLVRVAVLLLVNSSKAHTQNYMTGADILNIYLVLTFFPLIFMNIHMQTEASLYLYRQICTDICICVYLYCPV